MHRKRPTRILAILVVTLVNLKCAPSVQQQPAEKPSPQIDPKLSALIQKSIDAVGLGAKHTGYQSLTFKTVENALFRTEGSFYYITKDGRMRIEHGIGDLIDRVWIVDQKQIRSASFAGNDTLTELQRAELICMAKLSAGLFSLQQFADQLSYQGNRKYGPEIHEVFATQIEGIEVHLHTDKATGMLKRMRLLGTDAKQGRYEASFDFNERKQIQGLQVPKGWYRSFIGPINQYDTNIELSDLIINPPAPKRPFETMDLSFGQSQANSGKISGQVVAAKMTQRKNVVLTLNWTPEDISKLEIQQREVLTITLGGKTHQTIYIGELDNLTGEDAASGGIFLFSIPGDPYIGLVFFGPTYHHVHKAFVPLQPVQAEKKPT